MAIYRRGADTAVLRASADRVLAHARICDEIRAETARSVRLLADHWSGPDLDRLMAGWPRLDAELTHLGSQLGELAEVLRRNATQQETASGMGAVGPSGPPSGVPGVPLGPGVPAVPGLPASPPGGPAGDRPWHDEFFNGNGMTAYNAFMNLTGLKASALGLVGHYAKLDDFTFAANMYGGSNWKTLFQAGMSADELGVGMSRFASTMGVVGKAIGPIGAALSWGTVASDIASENYDRAAYNTVMATLGTAALLPVPPANLICGGVAAAMGVGQLLYDNNEAFQGFVDDGAALVGDAAGAVADAAGDLADAAGDALDAVTPDIDWPW